MNDFERELKKAADRYSEREPAGGEPSPDCSRELEDRVEKLLARKERKEDLFMKKRTKWTALIAAAAVLVVMTVVVAASPVIRNYLHSRFLTEDSMERLTEVPDGWIGVYTAEDLDAVRYDLGADYILMEDITFDPADFGSGGRFEGGWSPIGTDEMPFCGTFNGNGHVIRGLCVTDRNLLSDELNANRESGNYAGKYVGLFGYCRLSPRWGATEYDPTSLTGYIKNLGLEDGSVTAGYGPNDVGARLFVGGIAGYSDYVIGCYTANFEVRAEVTCDMGTGDAATFWSGETVVNTSDYVLAVGGVAGSAYLIDSCWSDAAVTVTADPADADYNYVSGVCGLTSACITSYFSGTVNAGYLEDRGVCAIRENDVPRYMTREVFDEIANRLYAMGEGELFVPSLDTDIRSGEWYANMFMSFYCLKSAGVNQPFREAARDLIAADMDTLDIFILDPDLKPREYARLSSLIAAAFPDGSFEDYCRDNAVKYGNYYVYDLRIDPGCSFEGFDYPVWKTGEDGMPRLGIFG